MEERSTRVYRQKQMFSKEELVKRESLCIHDEPAYCVAACPVKLDTKAFVAAVAAGNYNKARALYEKVTPFVHLLSAGCEAPCRQKCKLREVGDEIDVPALEAAAVAYGTKRKSSGLLQYKKKNPVAIFGASLFSTFLSGELTRKAYPLTVYCAEPDAAAFLSAGAEFLDAECMRAEVETLREMDIEFRFNVDITADLFEAERLKYDMVCLSPAHMKALAPCAEASEETLMCPMLNAVSAPAGLTGVLNAAFAAKKAALSIDRLAQKLDPGNSRGGEGAFETALVTSLECVKPTTRVTAQCGVYTPEEAESEAARCIQCGCEECVKGCAYLQYYKKYPKLLTREIYNNVGIIMGDHIMNKPINACALCGQCAVLCPNGFDMAEICLLARRNMVSTDKMPLAPHEFALLDQRFSNTDAFLCRSQPGFDKCKYVFYPGCQATAIAPETVKAAWLDLSSRLKGGVALMLGCCGAISEWAGRYEMAEETSAFIDAQFAALGSPTVIAGCPTCKKTLARHDGVKLTGIWDVLDEIGLPEGAQRLERPVVIHDACGARGEADTQKKVRHLAERLGCTVVDVPYSGDEASCCGYGGLTLYASPEVAHAMTETCLKDAPDDVPQLSYCMACRDRFAREGKASHHLLELVYGTDAGAPPDISRKRANRLNLKNSLLHDYWGEEMKEMTSRIHLEFTPEALVMMDERMILKDDVIEVMEGMLETGEAIADLETGVLTARKRVGNVTFWVKYREKDDGYMILGAYSHRMKIELRQSTEARHGG